MLRIDSIKNEAPHKDLSSMKLMGENSDIHSGDSMHFMSELVLIETLKVLADDELLKIYKKAFARNDKAIQKINIVVTKELGITERINCTSSDLI